MKATWTTFALSRIEADFNRSADTHLIRVDLPATPDIQLYFKDESTHVTGSLKHRLARSLFLYGLCHGWIHANTPIIEASSGSTAVSEAYFARLLGLPFIAVMPAATSPQKVAQIKFYGGQCHLVADATQIEPEARRLAAELKGHFMDQFTYAERATDWRGNNNIAQSIYEQMSQEPHPIPRWIVVGAGTGGTAATIGRYIRYQGADTQLCVVDPEHSVFFDAYRSGNMGLTRSQASRIEGIGRPRVEPSFIPSVVDRMIKTPDTTSLAAIHFLEELLGRKLGGSTGTNLYGTFQLLSEMAAAGEPGSIVTLICDDGARYLDTYYNPAWLAQNGYHLQPDWDQFRHVYNTGEWPEMTDRCDSDHQEETELDVISGLTN